MSTNQSRKHRGYRTQKVVADWLQERGFPFAEPTGAGRGGRDILGTPGLAIEVKARSDLNPLAWVKQAESTAGGALPLVVFRCNGQGETTVGDWLVLLRLSDATHLLRCSGYGDPEVAA